MPRKTPIYDTMVLGQFEFEPVNVVSDFFDSMQSMDCFIKAPNWDTIDEGCELQYITHYRQDREMKSTQARMLQNHELQALRNKNRLRSMLKNQRQLRRRFIEVNSFMREFDEKRTKAEHKIRDESLLADDLKRKCLHIRDNVQKLSAFRERLKETVNEYAMYETVIKNVCREYGFFATVKECTDRCDALMTAQIQITKLAEAKVSELENMRALMIKMTNEAALKVLGLKNMLTALEREYGLERNECLHWQKLLGKGKQILRAHDLGKERIYDSIHHIYRILCSRRRIDPYLQRGQIRRIMDFIKEEVLFIRDILYECRYGGTTKKISRAKYC